MRLNHHPQDLDLSRENGLFQPPFPEQNRQANFALKKSTGTGITKVVYYEAADGNSAPAVTSTQLLLLLQLTLLIPLTLLTKTNLALQLYFMGQITC